jgi:uncharacterized protein (DUF488 family)
VIVYTIGHSTRTVAELVALLKAHGVATLVDVRTVPRSRHTPQFNRETLPGELQAAGIAYIHMGGLGGLRRPQPNSMNTGWRSASFRGYADYMLTDKFEEHLNELFSLARERQTAIMCAEAVPWRCHRSMIADALVLRGVHVEHIMSLSRADAHQVTPWAHTDGIRITYPAPQDHPSLPDVPATSEQ